MSRSTGLLSAGVGQREAPPPARLCFAFHRIFNRSQFFFQGTGDSHHVSTTPPLPRATRQISTASMTISSSPGAVRTCAPISTAGQALFAPDTNHFGSVCHVQLTARITAF